MEKEWGVMVSKINPTLYDVLNVSSDASAAELKSAWRSLVKEYHPDRFKYGSPEAAEAEERLKLINTAYDTLKDPASRSAYDQKERSASSHQSSQSKHDGGQYRQKRSQPPPNQESSTRHDSSRDPFQKARSNGGGGPREDIFDTIFGASRRGHQHSSGSSQRSGFPPRQDRGAFDGMPSFSDMWKQMERDKPIFDEMRRQMERDKPIYDAMRERIRTDPIYDQMREQMKRDKPIFDAMRERMRTDPIFAELRQRMSGGQGPGRPWDNDDPEPF